MNSNSDKICITTKWPDFLDPKEDLEYIISSVEIVKENGISGHSIKY